LANSLLIMLAYLVNADLNGVLSLVNLSIFTNFTDLEKSSQAAKVLPWTPKM